MRNNMKSIKKKPDYDFAYGSINGYVHTLAYAHAAKATAKRSLVWTIWRAQK